MLILSQLLLAAALGQATPVAQGIDAFCKREAVCVARQREALRYFLNHWVVFDASELDAKRCMVAGKRGRTIDWTVAEQCIRTWSKGRKSILPGVPKRS